MADVRELLRTHPLSVGFDARQLDFLASVGDVVYFEAGETVFSEGGPADAFYFIVDGEVGLTLLKGRAVPVEIQTLHSGELLGLSWLYTPYEWALTATAERATTALRFDAEAVRKECALNHELGYTIYSRLLELVGKRLQATRLALLELPGRY
jgi:CRP-like cAMP-binding protein